MKKTRKINKEERDILLNMQLRSKFSLLVLFYIWTYFTTYNLYDNYYEFSLFLLFNYFRIFTIYDSLFNS